MGLSSAIWRLKTKLGRKLGLTVRSITNWMLWWIFYGLTPNSIQNFHNFTRYLRSIGGLLNRTKGYMCRQSDKFLTFSIKSYLVRLVHYSLLAGRKDSIIVAYVSDLAKEMFFFGIYSLQIFVLMQELAATQVFLASFFVLRLSKPTYNFCEISFKLQSILDFVMEQTVKLCVDVLVRKNTISSPDIYTHLYKISPPVY